MSHPLRSVLSPFDLDWSFKLTRYAVIESGVYRYVQEAVIDTNRSFCLPS